MGASEPFIQFKTYMKWRNSLWKWDQMHYPFDAASERERTHQNHLFTHIYDEQSVKYRWLVSMYCVIYNYFVNCQLISAEQQYKLIEKPENSSAWIVDKHGKEKTLIFTMEKGIMQPELSNEMRKEWPRKGSLTVWLPLAYDALHLTHLPFRFFFLLFIS